MADHAALSRFLADQELQDRFGSNALIVFAASLRFGVANANDFEEAVTDGGGDKGCDFLFVHEPTGTAVIGQAYLSDQPKDVPKVGKAADLNSAVGWVLNPEMRAGLPDTLRSAAEQLDVAFEDGAVDTIELWFSHNSEHSIDVEAELKTAVNTADAILRKRFGDDSNIDVRFVQVDLGRLDSWLSQSEFAILVDARLEVPAEKFLEEKGTTWRAAVATVPGSFLKALFEDYGPEKLFSGNIRDYLGRRRSARNINFGIETTANQQPTDFFAFNNGVTALVGHIEASDEALTVDGITIVNGAQTTGALAKAAGASDTKVLIRFVECSDPATLEDIVRYNNTQNAIAPSDFRSRDNQQKRLRAEFSQIPNCVYTGARRGPAVAQAVGVVTIESDEAAQALAAFHGAPELAYHGKSRIWEDDALYGRLFGDATSAKHIVYTTSLAAAVLEKKAALRLEGDDRKQTEEAQFQFLAKRGAPYLLVAAIGECQEVILNRKVNDRFSLSFGTEVSPEVAREMWTPVVDTVLSFHAVLLDAAESGNIRQQAIRTAAIQGFAAQVEAFSKSTEAPAFKTFAANVV
jgi:hypothetical protein